MQESKRVLLIEDNPGDARMIQEFARRPHDMPYEVEWVDRFEKGMEQLSGEAFDAILLDLSLPDAQGLQGVRRLHARFPAVPVIVLTGLDDEGIGVMTLQEGAQDYLVKGQADERLIWRSLRYSIERHRIQRDLHESQRQYRELVEASLGLVCKHDLAGVLLLVNPASAELIGYEPSEITGRNLRELVPDPFREAFDEYLVRIQRDGKDSGLLSLVARNGTEHVLTYRNVLRRDPDGRSYVLGHAQDVTDRLQLEKQLRDQSFRDPLTGCWNRRLLVKFEADSGNQPWGCLVIDIDQFKKYNDSYGHEAGDEILVQMARFLGQNSRALEAVVRMGGDEFCVLLSGLDEEAVESVARRMRDRAASHAPVSFSLGWAARRGQEPLAETIARADQNLREVRVAGRSWSRQRRRPR